MDFVLAPFLPRFQPALGVGTLLAVLRRAGVPGRAHYLNLELLRRIGAKHYDIIANWPNTFLLGEMIFSGALWGVDRKTWDRYVENFAWKIELMEAEQDLSARLSANRGQMLQLLRGPLTDLYGTLPTLVARQAGFLVEGGARVLGFSTTFQQNVASLALARAVRVLAPPERVAIVFGGANCEGDMGSGLAWSFPFLDVVVQGEADALVVDLHTRLRRWQEGDGPRPPRLVKGSPTEAMDELPIPEFDDWAVAAGPAQWFIPMETARGCWWGARSHCTFCGLNGGTMRFRSKSPARVREELRVLQERHGARRFMVADNILDWRYFSTLISELGEGGHRLFVEVKSNLSSEQVAALKRAGIDWIQPGIESLSTPVLDRIGKGARAIQQVALLRACAVHGVQVSWNLLCGFPGDQVEDYEEVARVGRKLAHLTPPSSVIPLRLDRFSPYHDRPEELGVERVRAGWPYAHAYRGVPAADRERIAYFFEYDYQHGREPPSPMPLIEMVQAWRRARARGARLQRDGDRVIDTRDGSERVTELHSEERALLDRLDRPSSPARLDAAECALAERLVARDWLLACDGQLLSLVIPTEGPCP